MKLTHPHVRHLYWSICSQELAFVPDIPTLPEVDPLQVAQWCEELDQQPELLDHYIQQQEHRLLGSYFEVLWQFFFTHFPQWQLLGSRIQIPPSGPTLGELDILCQPPTGATLHVELAIKIYLRHPEQTGLENRHWLGPRTNDRLDLKLEKLQNKQFRMLEQPATIETLSAQGLPTEAIPTSVIKGYLFEPWSTAEATKQNRPTDANPECLSGYWIHADQVEQVVNLHPHWQIIEKWQWLGPYRQGHECKNAPLSAKDTLKFVHKHFQQPSYALMLIALNPDESGWCEKQRYMVVHSSWPH